MKKCTQDIFVYVICNKFKRNIELIYNSFQEFKTLNVEAIDISDAYDKWIEDAFLSSLIQLCKCITFNDYFKWEEDIVEDFDQTTFTGPT
jgi:hypothetical protein